jgi:hypothetical protein
MNNDNFFRRPIWEEFSENAHRIRRNLLISLGIAYFITFSGKSISGTVNVLGIEIGGITIRDVFLIFFLLITYHLLHFVLASKIYYQQWKVKRPNNKTNKNSTLYNEFSGYVSDDIELESNLRIICKRLASYEKSIWDTYRWQGFYWLLIELGIPILFGVFIWGVLLGVLI